MKIDKKNARHWLYLILFGLNVFSAIALRPLRRKQKKPLLIFYGHRLSGNLLALYERILKMHQAEFEVSFLTMDRAYHRKLMSNGFNSVLAISFQCMHALIRADAVVSDHGLHVMFLMLSFSNLKFFDVWHGIPFKGFDGEDFRVQQRYDECWVASPLMKKMYIDRFGFEPDRVKVTGYARTDLLVTQGVNTVEIKRRFGLGSADLGKVVLFAPTWKQDTQQRSIFPFAMDEQSFMGLLSELALRSNSTFVMRAHLNNGGHANGHWPRIIQLPYAEYPDTEALLLVSDILVCDWSSIAFDYLLLDRPTIFLDVEAPFAKGFSLDASYRFGPVIGSMSELLQLLRLYLNDASSYADNYLERAWRIQADVYGKLLDGGSAARCIERLKFHLM